MMKLKRFRVTTFRSVDDSGWIETDDVTALIGTNEAGKTNILIPLWKLNPAKEGAINPTTDYPRKHYNTIRNQEPKPVFIQAVFDTGENLAEQLSSLTKTPANPLREVQVGRRLDGTYEVEFPNAAPPRSVERQRLLEILESADSDIQGTTPLRTEEEFKKAIVLALQSAHESILPGEEITPSVLNRVLTLLDKVKTEGAPKTGTIVPRYGNAREAIGALQTELARAHPRDVTPARDLVLNNLPKFVFYSTYGNLDSEIYLPHVIENMARTDLGLKEQAKTRTLKVLFEFVKLKPQEILELGRDFREPNRQPTPDEIASIAERKKQRSILLQSASTFLTRKFLAWWKQGEYRFRFDADGDHFRIWVADDKRPEEIELEGRSTGLQWFLSFYLVFLVEQQDAHEGAILLLDEPGLSLHPLAQRDLSVFFNGLAKDNQLLYTCHSPFLVDADRLDRARKVYVDSEGTSKVTPDLRATDGDPSQKGAAYAVHAALGLSVAESLMLGCAPVVVEGTSDQHYLTAIKTLLISSGRLKPGRELVFPPAGGAKGVRAVASILGGRDDELPVALFDGDAQGRATADALRKNLYSGQTARVLQVDAFTGIPDSEIEDLFPTHIIAQQLDRWQRADALFADTIVSGKPIVPQIEAWATKHGIVLDSPGWKVELAKRVKQQLLTTGSAVIDGSVLDLWERVFAAFTVEEST